MKKPILFVIFSLLFLVSCHYIFGAAVYLGAKEEEEPLEIKGKYCNNCSCNPNNKTRKEFEDCNNDGKYNEDGEYLCCPNCMLVCKQKPRRW